MASGAMRRRTNTQPDEGLKAEVAAPSFGLLAFIMFDFSVFVFVGGGGGGGGWRRGWGLGFRFRA